MTSLPALLRRLALLVALCLAAVGVPATGAHAAGDNPVPPLSVTVSGDQAPRYGDDIVVSVRSTGSDVSASIRYGTTEVAAARPLAVGGTRFTIPNLDRFQPGQTYRFQVEASNETSSGNATFTFTPRKISASVTLSNPTTSYRSPFFGVVDADLPTAVVPTGRVELVQGGVVRATYDVRTDGTFALRDRTMVPGAYPGAEIRLAGSAHYADTAPGSGSATADLTVTKVTTRTTMTLTTDRVTQGGPLEVAVTPAFVDPYTETTFEGLVHLFVRPISSTGAVDQEVASAPVTEFPLTFDLTGWARTHEGDWYIWATYGDDPYALSSSAPTRRLEVRRPGAQETRTRIQLDPSEIVAGQPLKVFMNVTSDYDNPMADGGPVAIDIDGVERVRTAVTGVVYVEGVAVGTHSVVLRYLGTDRFAPSVSEPRTATVRKAATKVTLAPPPGQVAPGTRVPVAVAVTDVATSVVPAGRVSLLEGGRVLATAPTTRGAATLVVPALPAGTHRLQVRYDGDAQTNGSSIELVVSSTGSGTPGRAVSVTKVTKVKRLAHRRVRLVAQVTGPVAASGSVVVLRGQRVVARGVLKAGRVRLTTKRLPRGRSRLVVRFAGTPSLLASSAKPVTVRLR